VSEADGFEELRLRVIAKGKHQHEVVAMHADLSHVNLEASRGPTRAGRAALVGIRSSLTRWVRVWLQLERRISSQDQNCYGEWRDPCVAKQTAHSFLNESIAVGVTRGGYAERTNTCARGLPGSGILGVDTRGLMSISEATLRIQSDQRFLPMRLVRVGGSTR